MWTLLKLTLVLTIILLTPMVCRRIHVPSLVGFILAGVLLGPYSIGWIQGGETIQVLSKMGLLYIMFQAGVEIDLNDFQQYRRNAFIFGIFSFLLPVLLGLMTSQWLGYSWWTSLLLGAMYGSHTLMTYPIVSRYGIQKNSAVNITVGGTMLAITLSLMVLACVEKMVGQMAETAWWQSAGKLLIMIVGCIGLIPWLTRQFFKRWQDPAECFVMVMLMLVISALLTEWAGMDGILGAFLCGVMLNRLIPNLSPLMLRINFTGNTIFVPVFLVGVGTMIDITTLVSGGHIYLVAIVMIVTKLLGKWLAAYLTQKVFRMSRLERQLIFGLSHATAAGTLAMVTIGYQMGLFDNEILNGAVLMILVLCTVSGFVTEHAAKQIALQEDAKMESERVHDDWLMLSVGENMQQQLHTLCTLSSLTATETRECQDWKEAHAIIEHTETSISVYHEVQPLNTINRLLVAVPRYAEKEYDFISCFGQLRRLSSQIGAKVVFYASEETQQVLHKLAERPGKYLPASYHEMQDWEDVLMIAKQAKPDDMIVLVAARHATASYNPLFEQIPSMLQRFFSQYNYLLVYPEQRVGDTGRETILMDIPQASKTWSLLSRFKQFVLRLWRRRQTQSL